MAVNQQKVETTPSYKPSKEDAQIVTDVLNRIKVLKDYRKMLEANPYDDTGKGRTIEDVWDYSDWAALPHKYSHPEMRDWMSDNSHLLTYSKIDTATSILAAKNPEVEISPIDDDKYEWKSKVLEALYNLSWEKGDGRQQMIKFIQTCATYGFVAAREYHRYREQKISEMVDYDPKENKHFVEEKTICVNDEPFLEVLPIRDVWIDNRAKPYDYSSIRDWCWEYEYDMSTFGFEFPEEKYPNAKYIQQTGNQDNTGKDVADVSGEVDPKFVRLKFYESIEDDKFIITDGKVLLYEGPLINHRLSLVYAIWRMRNAQTIYGIGLPELLENQQTMIDRITNMSLNQIILSISGAGYYGGTGTLDERDAILEPKLKKLRDAEKIVFPKVPGIGIDVFRMIEYIENQADQYSGVTKSLAGEEVGKTLGEAVLNREAGLRRLSIPLQNIEFALERHAKLRIDLIQLIYGRPVKSEVIIDDFGNVVNEELYAEYQEEKSKLGSENPSVIAKYPQGPSGEIMRNQFRTERLPFEKSEEGKLKGSGETQLLEITPAEIRGQYDIRIKAFSTIPMSKALEQSKVLETFNLVAKLPDTDIYKAEVELLKSRGEEPDKWMKSEEDIMQTQMAAYGGGGMTASTLQGAEGMEQGEQGNKGALGYRGDSVETMVPPTELQRPASTQTIAQGFSQQLK